jgi:hypothetical protein
MNLRHAAGNAGGFGVFAVSVLLTACGGGGGSSAPPPPPTYTVGGSVSGLSGSVVLQNNGGGNLTVSTSGTFAFATRLSGGAAYAVTVLTQPSGQDCKVQNDKGTANANVSNVSVTCQTLLSISSSTPASEATEVARDVQPALVFSAALDAISASAANLTLSGGGGVVSADYQVVGTQVTLRPQRKLKPLTQYTLTVGTGLRGQGGEIVPAAVTRRFTTRDRTWGTAQVLEDGATDAIEPRIAVNANGHAVAVWIQPDGTEWSVWSSRYTPNVGWSSAEPIESADDYVSGATVAVDASGNAIAVWEKYEGSDSSGALIRLWSNRSVAGGGWGSAQPVGALGHVTGDPQLAMDSAGNAIVLWSRFDSNFYTVMYGHYQVGNGWTSTGELEAAAGPAVNARIAMNAQGNGMAVWEQQDGAGHAIWVRPFAAGTGVGAGWRAAQVVDTVASSSGSTDPHVALAANGDALVVWTRDDLPRQAQDIWANRLVAGSQWGTPTRLSPDGVGVTGFLPKVAADANGNFLVVYGLWNRGSGSGAHSAAANRFVVSAGWEASTLLETSAEDVADGDVQIAVDASGNAVAFWSQVRTDGAAPDYRPVSNRYAPGVGWAGVRPIELQPVGATPIGFRGSDGISLALDADGDAIAVWIEYAERRLSSPINIRVNRLE